MGISQQYMSKLEQSETITDDMLDKLAAGLGVTSEFIKGFNEEKAIYNIQSHITYQDSSVNSSQHNRPTIHNDVSLEKVVELFEKLLQSEREKVELLTKANEALQALCKKA